MKILLFSLLFLTACGKNSSPEGRMTTKIEKVNSEIEDLKKQNQAILDSIEVLNQRLKNNGK